jgi:hypothetical protein
MIAINFSAHDLKCSPKKGAHLLLQLRTKTLNGDLRGKFCDWYPGLNQSTENLPLAT